MRYVVCVVLLCCLAFSSIWAYRVNYETRDVVKNLKSLKAQISSEEEKLIMLEGEWAYLNRPERLSLLAERFFSYLRLMPMSAENFAEVDVIKFYKSAETIKSKYKPILDKAHKQSGDQR